MRRISISRFTQRGHQDGCSFCYPHNLTSLFNNGRALFYFYEIVRGKLIRGPLRCNDCLPESLFVSLARV